MKIFIWQDWQVGGGFNLIVAATDKEMAIAAIRNSPEYSGMLNYIDYFKVEPEIIEIEYGKVVHYAEYYE